MYRRYSLAIINQTDFAYVEIRLKDYLTHIFFGTMNKQAITIIGSLVGAALVGAVSATAVLNYQNNNTQNGSTEEVVGDLGEISRR